MISFYAKGIKYEMPSTATEVTVLQYLKLAETDDLQEQIRILSGLPQDVEVDELSLYQLQLTCEIFKGLELPKTDLSPLDLEDESFGTVYYCQQCLETLPKNDALIFMLCYIYSGESWESNKRPALHEQHYEKYANSPAWQYLPMIINYIEQIDKLKKKWNKLLASSYTDDELRAGVKKLEKFGIVGVLLSLAQKDYSKYDLLWGRKWSEILLLLFINKEESEYQRRYQKLKK